MTVGEADTRLPYGLDREDTYGGRVWQAPATAGMRQVTATAPPLFGAAARSHLEGKEAAPPPQVDRSPVFWPLALGVLLLAVVAMAVAPAGAVALP